MVTLLLQQERLCCEVVLDHLLKPYREEAKDAGVVLLPDEDDVSIFSFCETQQARGKWDPGLGAFWAKVEKEESCSSTGMCQDKGAGEGAQASEPCSDFEEGEVRDGGGKVKKKRRRTRGSGSHLSRKRHGRDLKSAGSNSDSRKARIANKWARESVSYQTSGYSLLNDGSKTDTGWHGRAPPDKKKEEIRQAYWDGSIAQTLGTFFPVPYQR